MSRSFRKYPRNKYNDSHMKKVFNRRLRRKIKAGLFDVCQLSRNDYRKVYHRYEISEGSPRYPLLEAVQPTIEVERPLYFYTLLRFDERKHLILGEKEARQVSLSIK